MSIAPNPAETPTVPVWDRGVRVFHWGLVLSVALCAFTGFIAPRNWLNVHLAAGSAVAALVCFRLIWGGTGSAYARFRSFPPSWPAIRAHLGNVANRRPRHYLGHNPLGAVMIYALLAVLTLLVVTGTVALGGVVKQGPLAFAVPFSLGHDVREWHELLAIGLLAMVAAHLAGVAVETVLTRENLARAMVTGRKRAPADEPAPAGKARPVAAAAGMLAVVAVAVPATIHLSALPAPGVPTAPLDPVYAKECGSCHFAYPPSLAPAPLWSAVMDGLPNHFGEDASLDAQTTAHLRDWLAANAAERWDTRPANLFRRLNPFDPQRITATPFWQHIHEDIPAAVFQAKAVGAKGACRACHQDAATGRFDPQAISVPKEAHP
jgi:cytochrome b